MLKIVSGQIICDICMNGCIFKLISNVTYQQSLCTKFNTGTFASTNTEMQKVSVLTFDGTTHCYRIECWREIIAFGIRIYVNFEEELILSGEWDQMKTYVVGHTWNDILGSNQCFNF